MSENDHKMWNVKLPYMPELPKFCKQSSCALSIYKQIFVCFVYCIDSDSLIINF